ncbi:DUF7261 family protein [Halorubrum sp. DTA98]|uniref:DUF7261 family protein n=1 Tax=Halorubrum sp. DTA98 TaxID=3402163 RepID=UPI003AB0A8B5
MSHRFEFGGDDDRGQLVLVAAAAIALALFPLVLAYLQLGYAGDVAAEPTGPAPGSEIDLAIEQSVQSAASDVAHGGHASPEAAATTFRRSIRDDVDRVETARVEEGRAATIEYAPDVANEWVVEGDWRTGVTADFDEPTVHGGVVIQERAGEPTVVAVAFDVQLVEPDRTVRRSVVIVVPG